METENLIAISIGSLALVLAAFAAYTTVAGEATTDSDDVITESDVAQIADEIAQDYSRQGEPLYTGSGMGYTIEFSNEQKHYISGDTHVHWEMDKYIGDRVEPDVAYLSSGNVYTMDLETAGWAASMIDPEIAVPIHYQTFDFMDQDEQTFIDELEHHREEGDTDAEEYIIDQEGEQWSHEGVDLDYIGHMSMFFEDPEGFTVAIDPWINTNPWAPDEWRNNPEEWPETDLILLTHGHLDHYSPEEVEALQEENNAPVVAEWELAAHMTNQGFENVVAVNKGANMNREMLQGAGATGAIEDMPDDMRIYTHWAKHGSSPATALGAAFGIVDDEELDH